jgi:autotransporter-associated beta strand protein
MSLESKTLRSVSFLRRKRFRQTQLISLACAPILVGAATSAVARGQVEESSSNWSGYSTVTSFPNAFTDVSATFVVPTVKAPSSGTAYSSYWVGLDGATGNSDPTVEQCGIAADISAGQSSGTYFAWIEFAPAGEEKIENFTISSGNTIHLDVTYEPSQSTSGHYGYLFDVDDETTGVAFDQTEFTSANDQRSTAEWIAEATSLDVHGTIEVQPMANFGSVTFTNSVAALNGGSDQSAESLGPTGIEMNQGSGVVAIPSNVDSDGETFTDYYASSLPDLVWKNTTGNKLWDLTSTNWNDGAAATAYGDACPVTFNDSNGGNYSVTLNTTVNPASVTVSNSSGNYLISGTGSIAGGASLSKSGSDTLTLDTANTFTGGTSVSAGKLLVGAAGALPDGSVNITGGTLQLGASTGLALINTLSISGGGTFDLNNNHLIINYTGQSDPITSIAEYLKSGFNGGSWNGPGIISSAAQTTTNGLRYGIGWADGADGVVTGLSSGQIELKYTLLGDANLDGIVNGSDFSILAANFGLGATNWDQGNFLYSSSVNGSDFSALAANFGQGDSGADVQVTQADSAALDSFAIANGLPLPTFAAVPEPASCVLHSLATISLLTRRRRACPASA